MFALGDLNAKFISIFMNIWEILGVLIGLIEFVSYNLSYQ